MNLFSIALYNSITTYLSAETLPCPPPPHPTHTLLSHSLYGSKVRACGPSVSESHKTNDGVSWSCSLIRSSVGEVSTPKLTGTQFVATCWPEATLRSLLYGSSSKLGSKKYSPSKMKHSLIECYHRSGVPSPLLHYIDWKQAINIVPCYPTRKGIIQDIDTRKWRSWVNSGNWSPNHILLQKYIMYHLIIEKQTNKKKNRETLAPHIFLQIFRDSKNITHILFTENLNFGPFSLGLHVLNIHLFLSSPRPESKLLSDICLNPNSHTKLNKGRCFN